MEEPIAPSAAQSFALAGRAALITGAAHGLGLAMATAFAGAGMKVAMVDLDEEGLASGRERLPQTVEVVTHVVDVRDPSQVQRAVNAAGKALGGLDVIVNDAAVYPVAPLTEVDPAQLLDVINVNVAGYIRVVQAARPWLVRSGHGRVINMASITFFLGFPDGLGAYIASKGGVIGITRVLARELGPHAVTVNAIAPGAFPTRAEDIIEDRPAYDRQILSSQCLKRRGTVSDIAATALFLASDAASFITGQTIAVDGGWTFN